MTWHGFFLGLLAFFSGFCFVLEWIFFLEHAVEMAMVIFADAISLYIYRLLQFQMKVPNYHIGH